MYVNSKCDAVYQISMLSIVEVGLSYVMLGIWRGRLCTVCGIISCKYLQSVSIL